MEKMFWRCFYVVVFCTGMLILSLVYPYVESYAMSHRASTAPGGEMLLWLVPLMIVFALDTLRLMRNSRGDE